MNARWQRIPRAAAGLFATILLLLGLLVVTNADADYRAQEAQRAGVRARILAISVSAAVDFGDMTAAREAIDPFGVDRVSRLVALYDAQGKLLTGFGKGGQAVPPRFSTVYDDNRMTQGVAPIVSGGRRIGTVLVRSDIEPLSRRLSRYALISVLAAMAATIVLIFGLGQSALRRANRALQDKNHQLLDQMEQREKVESELRQAHKMESIGQLTGGIAHDFNNMLAIVIGNLDIAERRMESDPDRARTAIGHALDGANRAAALTKRLLAFARRSPLQPQPIEADQLVANMTELLRRTLGEGVHVETVLGGGSWRCHADPGQLENAILNLAVNARDAMQGKGRLTIETMHVALGAGETAQYEGLDAGDYLAIAVTDDGPGMPRDVSERAFEPFFTTKGVGKGTGLGLAQVYGFVRQSGGHVTIASEIGRGTAVTIYLPRHEGEAEAPPVEETPALLPRGGADELVLVVEDEDLVRRMTVEALAELGYPVIEAANGTDALRLMRERADIRLLFTDMVMPELNGRELADRARAMRPALPVLFTTGYTHDAAAHEGLIDGHEHFLPKPFTVEQLAHTLRTVLASS